MALAVLSDPFFGGKPENDLPPRVIIWSEGMEVKKKRKRYVEGNASEAM